MAQVKVLEKHGVLTAGSGDRRAVLDYDSGLVYSYREPDKVVASYERGRWLMPEAPKYYHGGWGRSSRGDSEGYHLHQNARQLLRGIGAKVAIVEGVVSLLDDGSYNREAAQAVARLEKKAKKLGARVYFSDDDARPKLVRVTRDSDGTYKKPKGLDVFKDLAAMKASLQIFLKQQIGKSKKVGGYDFQANTVISESRWGSPTTVAIRDLDGSIVLNSQQLNPTSFETSFMGGQTFVQSELRSVAKYSIPFNVLASANLLLHKTKVLEQGPQSTHLIKSPKGYGTESRHFTGALLLENSGRKFLMDIDREEIKHNIFNAFFVEVNASVNSIEEAYESMVPEEIKTLIANKVKVIRQGEFFYVPTDETITVPASKVVSWAPSSPQSEATIARAQIAHGKGRPNNCYKIFGGPKAYGPDIICGIVSHSGREHRDVNLGMTGTKASPTNTDPSRMVTEEIESINYLSSTYQSVTFKLWRVVPNTTVSNFTIQGDVD